MSDLFGNHIVGFPHEAVQISAIVHPHKSRQNLSIGQIYDRHCLQIAVIVAII